MEKEDFNWETITLKEFAELRERVNEVYDQAKSTYIGAEKYQWGWRETDVTDINYWQLSFHGKTADYVEFQYMPDEWRDFLRLRAIEKVSNIFDKISPFEYIQLLSYYMTIFPEVIKPKYAEVKTELATYHVKIGNISEIEDKTIEALQKYLPSDYQISNEIKEVMKEQKELVSKLDLDHFTSEDWGKLILPKYWTEYKKIVDCFKLNYTRAKKLITSEQIKIFNKAIEFDYENYEQQPPILLARIMSEEELNHFKETGLVAPYQVDVIRLWDKNNAGNENAYTFMAMNNRKNALLNFSSVCPFLMNHYGEKEDYHIDETEEKTEQDSPKQLHLVFFTTDRIKDEMIYEGQYQGMEPESSLDDKDIYGRNISKEVAVPYYHQKGFNITKEYSFTLDNMVESVAKAFLETGLIENDKIEENTTSSIYPDFEKFVQDAEMEDESIVDKIQSFIQASQWNPDYFDKMENRDQEIRLFVDTIRKKYHLDEIDQLILESEIIQKVDNWHLMEPERMYDEEYDYDDYEYDYGYDYDDEYDEYDLNDEHDDDEKEDSENEKENEIDEEENDESEFVKKSALAVAEDVVTYDQIIAQQQQIVAENEKEEEEKTDLENYPK